MRHFLLSFAAATLVASSAFADADRAERLIGATRLADVITVMRQEGLQHAEAIEQGSFPGQGGLAWRAEAERIHDVGRAMEDMRTSLSESLTDDQIEPVIAFLRRSWVQKSFLLKSVRAKRCLPTKLMKWPKTP